MLRVSRFGRRERSGVRAFGGSAVRNLGERPNTRTSERCWRRMATSMPDTSGGILGRLGNRFRGSRGDGKPCYPRVPLAAAGVVAILFFLRLGFFQTLELKLLDEHFRLRGRRVAAIPVRIVAIDDG